ncbi:hypothetical protein ABIA03_004539 [Bradyrhizobium yuanmingense]
MRHRAADDEAARLHAGDLVDLVAGPGVDELVHGSAERARIREQGGDVAEHDPGLGIIRDGADAGLDVVVKSHSCLSIDRRIQPERVFDNT